MNGKNNTALHPFTPAQSKFMEEHYSLLEWFLSFRWLKRQLHEEPSFSFLEKEDLYDAALDGYMRAVQQYDERPELQKYSFTTVAVNAMRWELLGLIRKEARRRSRLNQDSSAYETALHRLADTPVFGETHETVEAQELWDRTKRLVTAREMCCACVPSATPTPRSRSVPAWTARRWITTCTGPGKSCGYSWRLDVR